MLKKQELKILYHVLDKEISGRKKNFQKQTLSRLQGRISQLIIECPSKGYRMPWFDK